MKKILLGIFLCGLCVLSVGSAFAAMSIFEFLDICRSGTSQQVEAAIKGGANSRAKNSDGVTLLMEAARRNPNSGVVPALVKGGADVNAKDYLGGTALFYAAGFTTNSEVITELAKAGADMNAKQKSFGQTPLIFAVERSRNPEIIIIALIKAGANANIKDDLDNRAIDYAKDNEKIVNTEAYRQLKAASK